MVENQVHTFTPKMQLAVFDSINIIGLTFNPTNTKKKIDVLNQT